VKSDWDFVAIDRRRTFVGALEIIGVGLGKARAFSPSFN